MMKVMWIINNEMPFIDGKKFVNEGWITGMLSAVREYLTGIELVIVYPQNKSKGLVEKQVLDVLTVGYYQNKSRVQFHPKLEQEFLTIFNTYRPDVIHVMGSEFPHTYSACLACVKLEIIPRLVISIQGLVSVCAHYYTLGLPTRVIHAYTLRDLLRGNIASDKKQFAKRGIYEVKALQKTKNVIGRTDWDYACTKQINPQLNYYFNYEVLREKFYDYQWESKNCDKYTIFVSQGGYPIKGLHFLLQALPIVKKAYPEVLVKVAGYDILNHRFKQSSYSKYLRQLILSEGLQDNVTFTGLLQEEDMIKEYKSANLFVSPSILENSSNSIGEAMLLGMPIIASDVGGTNNFIIHKKNGYLYPCCEVNMLAYYIMSIFENIEQGIEMGQCARKDALKIYNRNENAKVLSKIYEDIVKN